MSHVKCYKLVYSISEYLKRKNLRLVYEHYGGGAGYLVNDCIIKLMFYYIFVRFNLNTKKDSELPQTSKSKNDRSPYNLESLLLFVFR